MEREEIYCRETYMLQTDTGGDAWWDICISHASYASITSGEIIQRGHIA